MNKVVIMTAGIPAEVTWFEAQRKTAELVYVGLTAEEAGKFPFVNILSQPQTVSVLLIRENKAGFALWTEFVRAFRRRYLSCFIVCVHQHRYESEEDAFLRIKLADAGVSMVTFHEETLRTAMQYVCTQAPGRYKCTYCSLQLTEDALWSHTPLYHINEPNPKYSVTCPICGEGCDSRQDPFPVHLRNAHGPCFRGEVESEYNQHAPSMNSFSLVVCIRETSAGKQMLLVQEFASEGFWLAGGRVDPGETLEEAAIRECEEEAGCRVRLRGVLQFQYSPRGRKHVRLRVVFFAEPLDPTAPLKSLPDFESAGATWVDFSTLTDLHNQGKLRSSEPFVWGKYLQDGGIVHPMSVLGKE